MVGVFSCLSLSLLLLIFTEEGKHLEVLFPLAFHSLHHLPLWETLKAPVKFHWKRWQSHILSDLHLCLPGIQQDIRPGATREKQYKLEVVTGCQLPWSVISYFWLTCTRWTWWKCYLLCLHQPSASRMAWEFKCSLYKVAYQADEWKEGPPIIPN